MDLKIWLFFTHSLCFEYKTVPVFLAVDVDVGVVVVVDVVVGVVVVVFASVVVADKP